MPTKLPCSCVNIAMGSYDAQISFPYPFYPDRSSYSRVGVDHCIAEEVVGLWHMGIQTTGACCGHNKAPPYIGVEPEFIPRMKEMGYIVQFNPCRPGDEDAFVPKSLRPA